MRRQIAPWITCLAAVAGLSSTSVYAAQPLETETARMLEPGRLEVEAGFERQTSHDGTEAALPFAFEYGISRRFSLLIEPVPYTAIHDRGFSRVSGIGDLEVTLTTLIAREGIHRPAFALGTEVKVPTAEDLRIGSDQTDFALYLIGSKRSGRFDTHLNFGYTIVGKPAGITVKNVESFALATEYRTSARFDLLGEVFGSTAAREDSTEGMPAATGSTVTPEIGGAELVGTIGARWHANARVAYSLGVSFDNNRALLVHPGVAFRF